LLEDIVFRYRKLYKAARARGETMCRQTGQYLIDFEQDIFVEALAWDQLAVIGEGNQVVDVLIVPIELELASNTEQKLDHRANENDGALRGQRKTTAPVPSGTSKSPSSASSRRLVTAKIRRMSLDVLGVQNVDRG
jgi:hypothetical protein